MARVSLEEFKEKLAKGKPAPAVLLCGDQPFLRDACRAQLIEKFVPEAARAWAVSRFSAGRGDAGGARPGAVDAHAVKAAGGISGGCAMH